MQVVVHSCHLHVRAGRGHAIGREFRSEEVVADRLDRHRVEGRKNRRHVGVGERRHLPLDRHVEFVVRGPEGIQEVKEVLLSQQGVAHDVDLNPIQTIPSA